MSGGNIFSSGGSSFDRDETVKFARIILVIGIVLFVALLTGVAMSLSRGSQPPAVRPAAGTLYDMSDEEISEVRTVATEAAKAWLAVAYPADAAAFGKSRDAYVAMAEEGSPVATAYAGMEFDPSRTGHVASLGEMTWPSFPYRSDTPCVAAFNYTVEPAGGGATTSGRFEVTLVPAAGEDGTVTWRVQSDTQAR